MKSNVFVTVLDAVTATTESSPISIKYAEKVTIFVTRANHSSGSSAFTVTASPDGVTYYDVKTLIDNIANTNAQNYTRIATKTLSANGTDFVGLDLEPFGYEWIKVKVTESVDGTHTAKVLIEY
jgi:hypothetical protein